MASASSAKNGRADVDVAQLPTELRDKLALLNLELSEGDITQKGYEKKRAHLLGAFVRRKAAGGVAAEPAGDAAPSGSPSQAHRRHQRRLTRDENRYHSEVRAEAVQQALAQYAQGVKPRPSVLQPLKRGADAPKKRTRRQFTLSDSSSDDESASARGSSNDNLSRSTPPRPSAAAVKQLRSNDVVDGRDGPPPPDVTSAAQALLARTQAARQQVGGASPPSSRTPTTEHLDAVYQNTATAPIGSYQPQAVTAIRPAKVSVKIQQLLNTLQRPKKKPLHEYYNDDDAELEAMAKTVDPAAPKPEGAVISPARGEPLQSGGGGQQFRSVDAALQHWATAAPKAVAAHALDQTARPTFALSYAKLRSRAVKVAYLLLHKLMADKAPALKPADRVALVFPNNDPFNFLTAFYGCLLAGVVPVPIDVPLTKRDAGIQHLGFLLGSCGVQVALTSDACHKGLAKSAAGDVIGFKGWPKLTWVVSEHLSKPPKEWQPPPRLVDDSVAYIEYAADRESCVKGVCVSRSAVAAHCRALASTCDFKPGEVMVCVLDFKREFGLWMSVLASVFCGMQVIFVPYALMKVNPASWMLMVTRFRAGVALVKSRDLHWGLLATRDHKDVSLASLRMLLVADGANPWSLSSCDQFVKTFQSRGLRADALCPCAGSSETQTLSIRRPGRSGTGSSGRGVLSMASLSHGVVRVDQENSLTSLTLQDAGQVLAGGVAVVVRLNGPPKLCKADEVGEVCLYSNSCASAYWGLGGMSNQTFKGGLVFVCGSRTGMMHVSGRQHSADDLIATVLAVEPMKFVYRGRIVVFAVRVLRDDRICIVAEQKPAVTEEESFQWMSRVLQAVDSIHQVGVYCLALVPPNQLPKTALGGIHVADTKQRFVDGSLHPTNLLMCPHTCVNNLPKPREPQPDVGPAAMFVGNIVQGVRIASAQGRDLGPVEETLCLNEVLRQRSLQSPNHVLFTLVNAKAAAVVKLTCAQLYVKAERIGALLLERGHLNVGDHVALIFTPGTDLICAFYGCVAAGMVPVCVRPPHQQNLQTTLPTVRMIVDISRAVAILSTANMIKLLRSKEASHRVDVKAWPTILDIDDLPRKRPANAPPPTRPDERSPAAGSAAYLDFSVSTTGMLAGIVMSSRGVAALCKSLKLACELYPSRHVCLCLDPYCGLGFALWCLSSVYSGHHSILIPPSEVEQNPSLWLSVVSQYKVRDIFCSYGVMELCVRELAARVDELRERGVQLGCVRTCVTVAEERPRGALCAAFAKLFSPLGLPARAVSTSFGCRVNVATCMQGASSPDPSTLFLDGRALRNDRVTLVERGSPHSVAIMESGKLLPGVRVVIANPETRGQCADSHLGEIWVESAQNAAGYFTVHGEETSLHADHFTARLTTGDTRTLFARTGYLGFVRQTTAVTADGELHDALFVVGALDETLMLRGMRYHPVDVEASALRAHRKVCECAVFTWTNLLVVVAELEGAESEALDLVPAVTSAVLEDHHLVVGVVVVVDPGTVPINSRGEKQRTHLRNAFLHDQLDPIYVAYNM